MLTIEEIETLCRTSQEVQLPRHAILAPDLSYEATFYPYGFPTVVRTNCREVLAQCRELWGNFHQDHDTPPIVSEIQAVESKSLECPPEPSYRTMQPLTIAVADADNYSVADAETLRVRTTISQAALRYPLYARYFLLGMPLCCVSTSLATAVHAGCVALHGQGVLLCGDSGAGKSTLSYACARAGWTYISDDATYVANGRMPVVASGNCYQVRFRPSAACLFPELEGLEVTPRAAGKPSIELPTDPMMCIERAQTAHVKHMVFLNRRVPGPAELLPYRKDVARQFMRQVLFGPEAGKRKHYETIESLLTCNIHELRYTHLEDAIERLRALVEEGD